MPAGLTWTKLGPVFSAAQGQYSSICWPWVLDGAQWPLAAFPDQYVMFYSTDHSVGAGGIAAATAPTPAGPWTNFGQVFVDPGPGFSTETPSVWWDDDDSVWRMLYQQAGAVPGATQSTLQAVSADAVTWSKLPVGHGIVVQPGAFEGDGHTGYAIPLPGVGRRQMLAYHLMGGGDRPTFGMSGSEDGGDTWRTDPRPLLYGTDQLAGVAFGMRIEWNSGHVYHHNGSVWWIGLASSFGSGGGSVARHIIQAPLSPDGRRLIGEPERIFPTDPAVNLRALFVLKPYAAPVLRLYYQVDDVIHMAEAWTDDHQQGLPVDVATIPYGRVERVMTETFWPTKTGTWLEIPAGSAGSSMGAGSYFYYQVGNTTGTPALRTIEFNPANHEMVGWYIDGFHVSDPNMAPGISLKDAVASPTRGVSVWTPIGSPTSVFRAFGSGQPDATVQHQFGGVEGPRRRNLGLELYPKQNRVRLVAGDQEIFSWSHPSLTLGPLRGYFDAAQGVGLTSGKLRLAQARLVLKHN